MDPITTAILAALTIGITGGIADVMKKMVNESYELLKKTIKVKLGSKSKVVKAINDLEKEPNFEPYQQGLHQRISATKLDRDTELLKIAADLISKCNTESAGRNAIQNIQNVYGDYNAVAGAGGKATVKVNRSKKKK